MKHVAVIGAGIIGASIARELALAGCRVTVFEAYEPANGASSRSMGWINASFIDREDYYLMRLAAIQAWWELDNQMDGALQVQWTGSLNWEDSPERYADLLREFSKFDYNVKVVNRDEIARLEPELADLPDQALLMENEGVAEGAHVTAVLLRAAQEAGAQVIAGVEVNDIERVAYGFKVVCPAGRFEVDDVVVAAGVATGDLLSKTGQKLPMNNEPGLLIETAPVSVNVAHNIWSPDIHFKQLPDRRLISGNLFSGAFGGDDVSALAERMLDRLKQRLPRAADELRIEKVRYGVRPMPLDTYPAIGRAREDADFYVSVMHSGITLAPLVGSLVAKEIALGQAQDMLKPFRPARFNQ